MRRTGLLILFMVFAAQLLAGTTYYVDAVNGSDSNNGRSESSAWRTLSRIQSQSFTAGDEILLKRGQIWREYLIIDNVTGSSSSPVTFGAYSTGAKPQINGATVETGWSLNSNAVYQKTLSAEASVVVEDGKLLSWRAWKGSVSTTFSGASAGCWSCNEANGSVYVWCTNSADPDTHTMQVAAKLRDGSQEYGIRIRRASYVTVQDLEIINTTNSGILVTPSSSYTLRNIVLRRLTVSNNGMTGIEVNNNANNVSATNEVTGLLIEDNTIHDTNYHGIILAFGVNGSTIRNNTVYKTGYLRLGAHGITTWSNTASAYVHDCTIEGNTVHHSISDEEGVEGTGIHADNYSRNNLYRYNVVYSNEGSGIYNGRLTSGCKFYYNIGYQNGTAGVDPYRGGITLAEPVNVQVCNNVFYDNYPCGLCWFGDITNGVTLKNNILFENMDYEMKSGVNAALNVVSDYNCVYHSAGGRFMKWVGSDATWTEWLSRSGQDSHSLNANPRFVNAANKDFNLQAASPCIDAGTNLGLPKDFNGKSVPQGQGVDIGACEYISSAPALDASASGSPASGTVPLTVVFAGGAAGGTSPYTFLWTFGDGTSSTSQNPSHTYSTASPYTATLTVTDSADAQDSATVTINVTNASLSVTVGASTTSGQAPLAVTFSRTISGGVSPFTYSWTFGDGGTSTASAPSHTYTTAGTYTARLTVTDSASQQDSDTIQITVNEVPALNVSVSASPASGQIPLTVQFTRNVTDGVSPFTYSWTFGDGGTSTINNPSHTYTTAGTYTARLTVTDSASQQKSATVSITAEDLPPLSLSIDASPTSGQIPLTVQFTRNVTGGVSPFTYSWTFGDGGTSTINNPSHTYTTAGTYTARLTVTDSASQQKSASLTITATQPSNLNANMTASPASGLVPLAVTFTGSAAGGTSPYTYRWTFGDGGTSNAQNPSRTYSQTGTYTTTLTVTDSNSQQDSASSTITVYAQNSQFTLSIASSTGSPAPGSGGTINPSAGNHTYASGSSAQVTATPKSDYRFSQWTGDISSSIVGSRQINLAMDADKSITATFCSRCGDVNGDLIITPTDAQIIFEIFLGKYADPTPCQLENADVNCDGTKTTPNVTPMDAQTIFDFYLGKSGLPADCSCNSRAASASRFTSLGRNTAAFNLFVPDIHATGEKTIFVPVSIDRPIKLNAFGIDFRYDSSQLQFVSVVRTDITKDYLQIDGHAVATDLLRIGGYRELSEENILPGELVVLIFKVKKGKTVPASISIVATYDDLKTASSDTEAAVFSPSH